MREDTTGMSAEIIPVIPAVMISTGVVSPANPPVSGQQVTFIATARQSITTPEHCSWCRQPCRSARSARHEQWILAGLPAVHIGSAHVYQDFREKLTAR